MKVIQYEPYIDLEDYKFIEDCFFTKWITEGPKAEKFTNKICELLNVKYGVLAPNGTLALYLGLKSIGVGKGDEVVVPDLTFIASATAVEMTGATPVFVDVDRFFQINIEDIDRVVSKKTKALMPVHLGGMSSDIDGIIKLAGKHNFKIIEDSCQAFLVKYKDKCCGSFGDVGCFSFFSDKLITTGEGGFVATNNKEIYNELLYLRNQGRINRGSFKHDKIGYNFRMTDFQCSLGLSQLRKIEKIIGLKTHIQNKYSSMLKDVDEIEIIGPTPFSTHIPFRTILKVKNNSHQLSDFLSKKDIQIRPFFYPLHKQPCFNDFTNTERYNDKYFKNSNYFSEHLLCLPSSPRMTNEEIIYVTEKIKEFYNV